uniref:MRH domain-containing protein n=1 Tax=Dunaliella tertiolecta TaxID=3047 RepID=A0A7S3VMM3_DUNTE
MHTCSAFLVLAGVLYALVPSEAVQYVSETPKTFSASLPSDPRLVVGFVSDRSKLPGPRKDLASRPQYVMTASDGKQFTCYTYNETATPSQELQPLQGQIFPPVPQKSPFELLDSLTGLCLHRQQGLWTYSWCHKSEVYQLRQDKASKPKERFSLGSWPGEDAQVEDIKVDHTIASVPVKYVSHNFTGGDTCLLNGEPRTAEVRFTCMKDVKDSIIFSVNEFPTCNYVFVVATPFLCKHPEFKPQPEAVSSIVCVPQTSSGEDHHDIVPASSFGTTKDEDADADSSDIAGTADGGTSNEHVAGSLGMEEVLDVPGVAANSLGKEEVDGEEGSSSASSWHNAHAQEAGVTSEEGRGESRGDAQNQGVEDAEEGKAVGVTEGEASAQSTGAEVEDGHVLRSQGGPEGVGSISQQVGGSASEGEIEDGWMRSESEEQTDGGVGDNVSEHREGRSDEAGRQDRHGEGEEAGSGSVQGSMDGHDGWKWEWLEGQWHWVPAEGVSTGDTGGHGLSDGKEVGEHSEENKVEDNGRTEL